MLTAIAIGVCWIVLWLYWNVAARSAKPTAERQDWGGRLARIPVWLGFLLLPAGWLWPVGMAVITPTASTGALGVAISALGLFVAIWSRRALGGNWSMDVELKQGHTLIERGPYRLVRHPIYTGQLLLALGTAVASGTALTCAGFVSLAVGFAIKLRQEERLLSRQFPEEYPAYRARTKALIPYLL